MAVALEPAILTIFGITGDLAHRKLLPALYNLADSGILPETLRIVGITRSGTTVKELLVSIKKSVEDSGKTCNDITLSWIERAMNVVTMDITDSDDYKKLKSALDEIETDLGVCMQRLFYLAIPSTVFEPVVNRLGEHGLRNGCQHGETESRLLIEKPFGYDLASTETLIATLQQSFNEDQIYRIDHYLAKETVQNVLSFRFENPLFNGAWDKVSVSHIMITAAESIGIEGRVAFYEQMGAMRDLIQSHLLQLLALVTMEEPTAATATAIHTAKEAVFSTMQPPKDNEMDTKTVRGQYTGYKQEIKNQNSKTETYAALEISIDNDRWRGVPMFIRTGKALANKVTEITVVFKDRYGTKRTNTLTLRIQPHEGIVMDLIIKKPGYDKSLQHVQMDYCYEQDDQDSPEAYERVLVDSMRGDRTLFATSQEVLSSWHVAEPVIKAWENDRSPLHIYRKESWGPISANKLVERHGGSWLTDILQICSIHLPKN